MNDARTTLISAIAIVLVITDYLVVGRLSSLDDRITALEQTIEEMQHAEPTN